MDRSDLNLRYDRTNFVPPKGVNKELDAILSLVDRRIAKYVPGRNKLKYNLSKNGEGHFKSSEG